MIACYCSRVSWECCLRAASYFFLWESWSCLCSNIRGFYTHWSFSTSYNRLKGPFIIFDVDFLFLNVNMSGNAIANASGHVNSFYPSQRCRWGSRCLTAVIFHPCPTLLSRFMGTRVCWHKAKQAVTAYRWSAFCTAQEHGWSLQHLREITSPAQCHGTPAAYPVSKH